MQAIFKIIRFSSPLKMYYIAIAFFVVILSLFSLVNPFLTRQLVDLITSYTQGKPVQFTDAMVPLVIMLIISAVSAVFENISGYLGDRMSVKLDSLLSQRYYTHLMTLPIEYYDSEQTGKITARLDRSIAGLSQLMKALSNGFLQWMLTTVITLTTIAYYSWPIAVLLAVLFPIYIWVTSLSSTAWMKHQGSINTNRDIANGRFVESIGQVRVVKSYVQEVGELAFFRSRRSAIEKSTTAQSKEWHGYDIMRKLALGAIFTLITAIIVWQALQGTYSVGTAVLLITLAAQAQMPLFGANYLIEAFQKARSDSKDYFEVMDLKPQLVDHDAAKKLKVQGGKVEFRDVTFSYNGGSRVLTKVDFTIPAHSKVALVGESGQGKSTIANLIVRFYDAQSGDILIDDAPIKGVSQASLRKQVGIVFQDPSLFSGTIEENIAYGLGRKYKQAEIEQAARQANASDFIKKLPKGYKTEVGERGIKLSGGQKQRIIIARALLKNPPILILDEATSSLDAKAEQQVQQALERLMSGRTTIIIAHRLSTIANVDLIVGLKNGKIVEQGTPGELAHKRGGIYAELLHLQTAGTEAVKKKLKQFDISA